MRPMILSSRVHPSTVSVDGGALVVDEVPAPRHLCGPVPESFVVLPRPIRLTPAPVVVGTIPDWQLQPRSLGAQLLAKCRTYRYASPVPLVWSEWQGCLRPGASWPMGTMIPDKLAMTMMRHPAIAEPCGPVRLHDRDREQARLALRAIRAILWASKIGQ